MGILKEICNTIAILEKRASASQSLQSLNNHVLFPNDDGLQDKNLVVIRQSGSGTPITQSGALREYGRENLREDYINALGEDPYSKARRETGIFAAAALPAASVAGAIRKEK